MDRVMTTRSPEISRAMMKARLVGQLAFATLATNLLLTCPAVIAVGEPVPILLKSGAIEPSPENGSSLSLLLTEADGTRDGRHVLVQLDRIPRAAERAELGARGLELLAYIPERGYLAWVARRATGDAVIDARVSWAAPIPVDSKISEPLRMGFAPTYAIAANGRLRLVVKVFADVETSAAERTLERAGAEIVRSSSIFHRFNVLVPRDAVHAIASLDPVRWIELAPPPSTDDVDGSRAVHQANEVQAAPYSLTGADVDIGQVEGGNPDGTHDDLQGRVTVVEAQSVTPHATLVAGVALGDGTRSAMQGGTPLQWRGMATQAEDFSWTAQVDHLMWYATAIVTHGIEMSTNSWGWFVSQGSGNCWLYGNYSHDAPEIDAIIAGIHGKRISAFFGSGNERDDCDCGMSCAPPYLNYKTVRPPGGTSKNTITVGGIFSDEADSTPYTGWGPTDDGRLKPEIVASADEVGGDGGIKGPVPVDTYTVGAGTSYSVPATSGSAALFIEDFRAITALDPLPSTVKAHFVHSAEDLTSLDEVYLNDGPDYASGYGTLKIKDAIDQLRSGDWIEDSIDQGASDVYPVDVPVDASCVRVTLAWDDVTGVANADPALVNDLDLVVHDSEGVRRFPWTLNPMVPGDPAVQTMEDHLNPLEQVLVDSEPATGTWTVEVRGTTVPMGPQDYSLVWSHDCPPVVTVVPEGHEASDLRIATLHPSHPNPFGPWTTIRYTLGRSARTGLRVLDVRGRVVRTLVSAENQPAGQYVYTWRGRDDSGQNLASGIYFVELRAGGVVRTKKVTVLR